jgi:hypothetical protein
MNQVTKLVLISVTAMVLTIACGKKTTTPARPGGGGGSQQNTGNRPPNPPVVTTVTRPNPYAVAFGVEVLPLERTLLWSNVKIDGDLKDDLIKNHLPNANPLHAADEKFVDLERATCVQSVRTKLKAKRQGVETQFTEFFIEFHNEPCVMTGTKAKEPLPADSIKIILLDKNWSLGPDGADGMFVLTGSGIPDAILPDPQVPWLSTRVAAGSYTFDAATSPKTMTLMTLCPIVIPAAGPVPPVRQGCVFSVQQTPTLGWGTLTALPGRAPVGALVVPPAPRP